MTIKVYVHGELLELPWNTTVKDLHEMMDYNRESYMALVNGRPAPEDRYLEDGDFVKFVRITYHFSPVEGNYEKMR
ncbi:MAG: MoaD/ThiS family protein [Candidatus Methanodesulfokora sp.]|jgi:sulfur carrier protein ThiS|nr:MAG: thiamine biosynthesis protein ThiS [Candidatus Korarchaeota archaeon]